MLPDERLASVKSLLGTLAVHSVDLEHLPELLACQIDGHVRISVGVVAQIEGRLVFSVRLSMRCSKCGICEMCGPLTL